jgi:hypothetical protein
VSLVAFESRSKASSKVGVSSSPLHPIDKARKAAKTGNAKKRSFIKPPKKAIDAGLPLPLCKCKKWFD